MLLTWNNSTSALEPSPQLARISAAVLGSALVAFFLTPSLAAQSTPNSELVYASVPPIKLDCTTPFATLNAGTLYVNTCTVSGGSYPNFWVGPLPPGLTKNTTNDSVTIIGVPPLGHYEYSLEVYNRGYYGSTFTAFSLDVVPAQTYPSGKTVIRCLQKGTNAVKDPPLCQTCTISANKKICDKDSAFNPTGQVPSVPSDARATSVYLEFPPATYNVTEYTLSLSHKDAKTVQKQIAHQLPGQAASFATQAVPAVDFYGQLLLADRGQWNFEFSPLAGLNIPWGLDFQYDIEWQSSPPPHYPVRADRYYKIVSKNSGRALDLTGGPCAQGNGIRAQQWSYLGGDNQKFRFVAMQDYSYQIVVKHSGLSLDVEGGPNAVENGRSLQQYTYLGGLNQVFELIAETGGYVSIRAKHSGKVLDVEGGPHPTPNGTRIQQWDKIPLADNQLWQLIMLDEPIGPEPSVVCR
jgi:Ricin-type beta-trefoil lectin domain-like